MALRLAQQLVGMDEPRTLRFPIDYLPLPDVLLTARDSRLTGCIALRVAGFIPTADFSGGFGRASLVSGTDLLFFRKGQLVGLECMGRPAVTGLSSVIKSLGYWHPSMLAVEKGRGDGKGFLERLSADQLLTPAQLDEVAVEHARRRLFERSADRALMVDVLAGAQALINYYPISIDLRPSIAFGLVVHARAVDRKYQADRLAGQRIRLKARYDGATNVYRLPVSVVEALSELDQMEYALGFPPRLSRLSEHDTTGVLVFLDRLHMLKG